MKGIMMQTSRGSDILGEIKATSPLPELGISLGAMSLGHDHALPPFAGSGRVRRGFKPERIPPAKIPRRTVLIHPTPAFHRPLGFVGGSQIK